MDEINVFNKPSLSIAEQISLLKNRGLHIADDAHAQHYLSFIGYYRLSAYARYYYHDPSVASPCFKENTTFDNLLSLYIFDRELRLLVLDAIERIEVAFRVVLSNTLSQTYSPHWFMQQNLFLRSFNFPKFIETIKKETKHKKHPQQKRHPIFENYYAKYQSPELPASWMLVEALTLGTWSRVYDGLIFYRDKQAIADKFGLPAKVMESWLQSLTDLRNLCAHHERLWNRHFTTAPAVPKKLGKDIAIQLTPNHTTYAQLSMLQLLLQKITRDSHWSNRLKEHMSKYPHVNLKAMGFPPDWEKLLFWQLT